MSEAIDDVTILGGGDSGLLTALSIQKLNPGIDVSVVDDFRQEVPQVGKSTYWKIYEVLHDRLEIDEQRFVSEVKPVWKATVYFRDWCGYPEFHLPFDASNKLPSRDTQNTIEHYYYFYEEIHDSPDHRTTNEEMVHQGNSPWYFTPSDFGYEKYEPIAYHLDTQRFNSFLRTLCRERGVSLINDEVTAVETSGDRVERLRSKRQAYESDLFVDASGFSRVLKREQDASFREFEFPLDAAFTTNVERSLADVEPATVVESGEFGWFWQIDTFENRDLGYVYASEFVDDDAALAEFLEHVDEPVEESDVVNYEFSSGYYERAWEENLVVIGNAGAFVEPLQSTALTTHALAAMTLSNLLSGHGGYQDDGIRDRFNAWVRRSWESINDFVAVHYRYADGDNEFWRAMQSIPVSDRVELLIREFDRNGFDAIVVTPTQNDPGIEELQVFHPADFYLIMRQMGATSEFYEDNTVRVSDSVERTWDEFYREIRDDVESHLTTREFYDLKESVE